MSICDGSGLLYMFHKNIETNSTVIISSIELEPIALLHTLGAFLLVAFLIVHVYMTTTGHSITSNISAMITGYEELEEGTDVYKDTKSTSNDTLSGQDV